MPWAVPDRFGSQEYVRRATPNRGPTTPQRKRCGLGSSPFDRLYLGNLDLISLPPGTEMFQFPGFASTRVDDRSLHLPGCPIRIPQDQRMLAPPPGFSQLATSFIAWSRLGIPRTLLPRLACPCLKTTRTTTPKYVYLKRSTSLLPHPCFQSTAPKGASLAFYIFSPDPSRAALAVCSGATRNLEHRGRGSSPCDGEQLFLHAAGATPTFHRRATVGSDGSGQQSAGGRDRLWVVARRALELHFPGSWRSEWMEDWCRWTERW